MSTKITVTIETKNGPETLVLTLTGSEEGDNPVFNTSQVERILGGISLRVRGMYTASFGEQS